MIANDLRDAVPGIGAQTTDPSATDASRLTLELHDRRIEIEVSPVARGAAWPPETRAVGANPATFTGPDSGVYDRTVQDRDSLKLERAA